MARPPLSIRLPAADEQHLRDTAARTGAPVNEIVKNGTRSELGMTDLAEGRSPGSEREYWVAVNITRPGYAAVTYTAPVTARCAAEASARAAAQLAADGELQPGRTLELQFIRTYPEWDKIDLRDRRRIPLAEDGGMEAYAAQPTTRPPGDIQRT